MVFFFTECQVFFLLSFFILLETLKKNPTHQLCENNQISQFLVDLENIINGRKTVLNRRNSEKKEANSASTIFCIFIIIFNFFLDI